MTLVLAVWTAIGMIGLRFFSDARLVEASTSLKSPTLVFLYTLQAMIFVSTRFGVAHIARRGIGTAVSYTMITVTRFEANVILER